MLVNRSPVIGGGAYGFRSSATVLHVAAFMLRPHGDSPPCRTLSVSRAPIPEFLYRPLRNDSGNSGTPGRKSRRRSHEASMRLGLVHGPEVRMPQLGFRRARDAGADIGPGWQLRRRARMSPKQAWDLGRWIEIGPASGPCLGCAPPGMPDGARRRWPGASGGRWDYVRPASGSARLRVRKATSEGFLDCSSRY